MVMVISLEMTGRRMEEQVKSSNLDCEIVAISPFITAERSSLCVKVFLVQPSTTRYNSIKSKIVFDRDIIKGRFFLLLVRHYLDSFASTQLLQHMACSFCIHQK